MGHCNSKLVFDKHSIFASKFLVLVVIDGHACNCLHSPACMSDIVFSVSGEFPMLAGPLDYMEQYYGKGVMLCALQKKKKRKKKR